MKIRMKLKIYAPIWMAILTILMLLFNYFFHYHFMKYPFNLVGLVFILLGILLMSWAGLYFKVNKTTIIPDKKMSSLITKGPYKFSRNPIYLGDFLILIGIAFLLRNPISFIFCSLFVVIINFDLIKYEEKQLEKKFGKRYLEYKKKVRRWI